MTTKQSKAGAKKYIASELEKAALGARRICVAVDCGGFFRYMEVKKHTFVESIQSMMQSYGRNRKVCPWSVEHGYEDGTYVLYYRNKN